MKSLISILFIIIFICSFEERKENLFSDSYEDAIGFINNHNELIIEELGSDKDLIKEKIAIIFPELLKYSAYKDIIETATLELLYVNYGTDGADFSIGYFQMKPSFIEKLECEILNNNHLKTRFEALVEYSKTDKKEIRKERIQRLKELKWQLCYLTCFYQYISIRFKNEKWINTTERLTFYSAAYNSDFLASKSEITKWSKMKIFPYGIHKGTNQYSYSKIALDFYNNSSNSINIF